MAAIDPRLKRCISIFNTHENSALILGVGQYKEGALFAAMYDQRPDGNIQTKEVREIKNETLESVIKTQNEIVKESIQDFELADSLGHSLESAIESLAPNGPRLITHKKPHK